MVKLHSTSKFKYAILICPALYVEEWGAGRLLSVEYLRMLHIYLSIYVNLYPSLGRFIRLQTILLEKHIN